MSTTHAKEQTYTIHIMDGWTIDGNEENKILITSHDITKYDTNRSRTNIEHIVQIFGLNIMINMKIYLQLLKQPPNQKAKQRRQ